MDFTTTLPAPKTTSEQMVVLFRTNVFAPINVASPICTFPQSTAAGAI